MTAQPNGQPVLVTGATGLLGARIVAHLHAAGLPVRAMSRHPPAAPLDGVAYVRADLLEAGPVHQAVRGCCAVVHCAGEKRDAGRMRQTNVEGTALLLEACEAAGIRAFCHISSVGVIGRTDARVVTEDAPCRPMNEYERTKLQAERLVADSLPRAARVILRPTNVFGEETLRAYLNPGGFQRLKLFLKTSEQAHLVYVEDVAAAVRHCLRRAFESAAGSCEVYIVSSDFEAGNTHGGICRLVQRASGRAAAEPSVAVPSVVPWLCRFVRHGRTNRGDVRYSGQRLAETGFEMPFGLENGIRHALTTGHPRAASSAIGSPSLTSGIGRPERSGIVTRCGSKPRCR